MITLEFERRNDYKVIFIYCTHPSLLDTKWSVFSDTKGFRFQHQNEFKNIWNSENLKRRAIHDNIFLDFY